MFYQHQQQNPQPTTLAANAYPLQYCQHQQPESQPNQQPIVAPTPPSGMVFPQLLPQSSNFDSSILQLQSCSVSSQNLRLETEKYDCKLDFAGAAHQQNSDATELIIGDEVGTNDIVLPAEQSVWVMRESYLKRRERDEQKCHEPSFSEQSMATSKVDTDAVKEGQCEVGDETDRLLENEQQVSRNVGTSGSIEEANDNSGGLACRKGSKKEGELVVLMARRMPGQQEQSEKLAYGTFYKKSNYSIEIVRKAPRVVCHVFESEEANFIAQSIGQAFQVAYTEFLRANGIDDPNYLRDIDYQEVLNSQEMMAEELELLARKETQKDVIISKRTGEPIGIVIVESGWGSMLPTSVVANMAPGGPAARSNQLNIGDQNARSSTAVRLTIVSTPPVVEVRIRRPDTKYQLGFSVQNGIICSLLRGGIAERGGIRVG
uniref:AP2/ERF domain-containing protein n=1 Tax=Meloidogyne hapla TaxID=6305 RepID=A0A1I8BJG0_MELHA